MLVRAKRYGMKTININGKEYTKEEFLKKIYTVPSISGLFENLNNFPRHEPEPPTVLPMSELPELKLNIVALLEYEDGLRNWEDGISNNSCVLLDKGGCYFASRNYTKTFGERLLGWIPKQVLPNPNEIKL